MKISCTLILCSLLLSLFPGQVASQALPAIEGYWVFNEKQSDSTDDKVEKALRDMGQKASRGWFNRNKEFYRGGPADQELYDRISYDRELLIEFTDNVYHFTYAGEFRRPVYTDNRSRAVSLAGLDEVEDFSFAHWEGSTLMVEARPRDGGFATEEYTLINAGSQLQVILHIEPRTFTKPIEIVRVFDRRP